MNHKLLFNFRCILVYMLLIVCAAGYCQTETGVPLPDGAFPIVYHQGHLYILCQIDHVNGNFVFDTGADNLYFDSIFHAEHLSHYDQTVPAILPGAGKTPQNVEIIMNPVTARFSSYSYTTNFVPIFRLKPILGDFADGLLGKNYFQHSVLEINYEKEYMKLFPSIDSVQLDGWSKIEMKEHDNRLFVPLSIAVNDSISISGDYILDLGAGSTGLTSLVANEYHLSEIITKKAGYFTKYGGVGGESGSYDFFAEQLTIGSYRFEDVCIDYSTDQSGALASEKYKGLLGNDILKRFDVMIDFSRNNLYLKPNSNFDNPFNSSRYGFSYTDRSRTLKSWIVSGMYQNSPAQKSGLQIDDQIIAVNGIAVKDIPYNQQSVIFKNVEALTLDIERNGKQYKIFFELKWVLPHPTINNNKRE